MDIYYQVGAEMAAALEREPPEVQQSWRYLFARVALEDGILELIDHEVQECGERLVCRVVASGEVFTADRPPGWSQAEEAAYIAEMRLQLLGDEPT